MLSYTFFTCDANGRENREQALPLIFVRDVDSAIATMVNLHAPAYAVCAVGSGQPTPMVYVKPAPAGGWDVWSNEILETEEPFDALADALLDAVDVADEYIDGHADWN